METAVNTTLFIEYIRCLYNSTNLCDTHVVLGNEKVVFKAHYLVLSRLPSLIFPAKKENDMVVIRLSGISSANMEMVLKTLYCVDMKPLGLEEAALLLEQTRQFGVECWSMLGPLLRTLKTDEISRLSSKDLETVFAYYSATQMHVTPEIHGLFYEKMKSGELKLDSVNVALYMKSSGLCPEFSVAMFVAYLEKSSTTDVEHLVDALPDCITNPTSYESLLAMDVEKYHPSLMKYVVKQTRMRHNIKM